MEKLNSKKFQDLKKKRLCWLSFNRRLFFFEFSPSNISSQRFKQFYQNSLLNSFNILLKSAYPLLYISDKRLAEKTNLTFPSDTDWWLVRRPNCVKVIWLTEVLARSVVVVTDWLECCQSSSCCYHGSCSTSGGTGATGSPPPRRDLSLPPTSSGQERSSALGTEVMSCSPWSATLGQ